MHDPDPIPISLRGNAVHARVDKPGVDTAQTSNPIAMGALRAMVPLSQIVVRTDYPYRTWQEHVRGLVAIFTPAELAQIGRGYALRILPWLPAQATAITAAGRARPARSEAAGSCRKLPVA